jgi:hypothetical protein
MENIIYNTYNEVYKPRYSFIIYCSNISNIIDLFEYLKKLYENNFEVIILNGEVLQSNSVCSTISIHNPFDINIFNNYLFKITYIKINCNKYNINKYYNYGISLSKGDIIIFQDSEHIYIDNILNMIKNYDLIDCIYTLSINLDNKKNYNDIFNLCIIHRKNLDIINGFDEMNNDLDLKNFFYKIHNICNLKDINSKLIKYYTVFPKETIKDLIKNSNKPCFGSDCTQDNMAVERPESASLLVRCGGTTKNLIKSNFCHSNEISPEISYPTERRMIPSDNNLFYKKRDYKLGIAITIFSDIKTPQGRIEASKVFINSLVENIKTTPIIFLIDYDIIDDHYNYLIEKTKNSDNIKIYKNIKNYGISKSKNICIKLLEEINVDYLCLLDDDILIKKDFTNYIIEVFSNVNISLLANINKKYKKDSMCKVINNHKFNVPSKPRYYGNFMCINRCHIEKYGYFILFPYKYGLEHIEFTERYLSTSNYKNHCLDLDDYFDDNIYINNKSQLSVHTVIIDNKKIKQNQRILFSALKNIKYIPFILDNNDMVKV